VKPLPEAVQAAFSCEAGNLRERPWWYKSRHGVGGADCLRRYNNTNAYHALWLAAEAVERGEHRREEKA